MFSAWELATMRNELGQLMFDECTVQRDQTPGDAEDASGYPLPEDYVDFLVGHKCLYELKSANERSTAPGFETVVTSEKLYLPVTDDTLTLTPDDRVVHVVQFGGVVVVDEPRNIEGVMSYESHVELVLGGTRG